MATSETPARTVLPVRRPPAWAWPLCIALQVVATAIATSYVFFFQDDFTFLAQAREMPFDLDYLRLSLFEHFSPVTRALNAVVVHVSDGSFALPHAIQLTLYAGALGAFAFVVTTILGNRWTAFVLLLLFGQSLILLRLLNWWTATANILPTTVFILLAIGGYLRWRRDGRTWWLVLSAGSYAVALLDYETAMVFPVYLLLISLLVMQDRLTPRAWLTTLWRERWAWLTYLVLTVAAVVNFYENYYYETPRPPIGQFLHYLEIALVETFVPATFGIRNGNAPLDAAAWVVALTVVLFVAAIAVTLYLRPRAWRALVAFGIASLVTMGPVGLNRIHLFGEGVGRELYYQQTLQMIFLVLTAFALSSTWGGRRGGVHRRPRSASTTRALRVGSALALAAYAALFVTSLRAMVDASVEPHVSRQYFANAVADLKETRARTGETVALIDHPVPPSVVAAAFAPFNRYSQTLPTVAPGLARYDVPAATNGFLDGEGHLLPVRFVVTNRGHIGAGGISATDGSGPARPSPHRTELCAPPSRPLSRITVPLTRPQDTAQQGNGLPAGVRIDYRTPSPMAVPLIIGSPTQAVQDAVLAWSGGTGASLVSFTQALTISQVSVDLPPGACVRRLLVGVFMQTS